MKVVDIKVNDLLSFFVNVEKIYQNKKLVLESIDSFLKDSQLTLKNLPPVDCTLIQRFLNECQEITDKLNRAFNDHASDFVGMVKKLLDTKLELLRSNWHGQGTGEQADTLVSDVNSLSRDLKRWASEVTQVATLTSLIGRIRFLDSRLQQNWLNKVSWINHQLSDINSLSSASDESYDEPEMNSFLSHSLDDNMHQHENGHLTQPACGQKSEPMDDFKQVRVSPTNISFKDEPSVDDNDSIKIIPDVDNHQNAKPEQDRFWHDQKFDLPKTFHQISRKEKDSTNSDLLKQNEEVRKFRQVLEDKINDLIKKNAEIKKVIDQCDEKRVNELTAEVAFLKQCVIDLRRQLHNGSVAQGDLYHDWNFLVEKVLSVKRTEEYLYREFCAELNRKNHEIACLGKRVNNLQNDNLALKEIIVKNSQSVCNEILKLFGGFKLLVGQVDRYFSFFNVDGQILTNNCVAQWDNQKFLLICLQALRMFRNSVEFLKKLYMKNALKQLQ